jgi:hypothetical protein
MRQLIIALLVALSACEGQQGDQPMNEPQGFFSLPADKLGTTAILTPSANHGQRGDLMKLLDLSIPDSQAQSVIISIRSEYSTDQVTVSQTVTGPFHVIGASNAAPIVICTLEANGLVAGQNVSIQGVNGNVNANVSGTIGLLAPLNIIGATFASPIEITTAAAHGYPTGGTVQITGVTGNTAANGIWSITVTGPNTFTLNSSVGNAPFIAGGLSTPQNMFSLIGSDGTISPTNFAYTGGGTVLASSTGGTGTGAPNVGSPLVGILQWGVGGGQNQIEFDIPNPKLVQLLYPTNFPQSQPMTNTGMGVQIAVSASHISLYGRNDSNIAPLADPTATDYVGNFIRPAKVIAFVSPGDIGSQGRLERTIYVAESISSLAGGAFVVISVPPFAQSLRIQRAPAGTPIGLSFSNNVGNPYRNVDLGPNDEGPIPLDPNCQTITLVNAGAIAIPRLQAVFDVRP